MHGKKAENLQHLIDNDYNVPPFYVIPWQCLKNVNAQVIQEQIRIDFEQWKTNNHINSVAVRSSAEAEDSYHHSFAGQFKTILNITTTQQVLSAIQEVVNARPHTDHTNQHYDMNIIIQEYISADKAGVCFTVNPATGLTNPIINVAKGVGTTVVEGQACSSYTVNRVSKKILEKHELGGDQNKLNEKICHRIVETALCIEQLFGYPQDIEWALKDNKLYVLQSRDITKINSLQVWDGSNLSESFPGIISPLTFSIARRGYSLAYRSQASAVGFNWVHLEKNHRIFDSMLGIFAGRVYYNLINWYRFIGLFPYNSSNQKFLDAQLQTLGQAVYLPKIRHDFWFSLQFWIRITKRIVFFDREQEKYRKLFDKKMAEYTLLPKGPAEYLMDQYTYLEQNVLPHMGRAVDNDFFVMWYNGILKKYFAFKSSPVKAMRNVISAQQAMSLYEIAALLIEDSKALNLLTREEYDKLDEYLAKTIIEKKIQEYFNLFGHRFAEDQKIESENPLLTSYNFYKLLKSYTQLNIEEIKNRIYKNAQLEENQEKQLISHLPLAKKILFRFLQKRLEHHLRIREHNRLLRGKVFALCRDIFKDLDKLLLSKGILLSQKDIYFLEVEELYGYLHGMIPVNTLQENVSKRKEKYKEYESVKMPIRFVTTGFPYKDIENIINKGDHTKQPVKKQLHGIVSSPGVVIGKVIVLEKPTIPDEPFDILVVSHTDPGWTPLIALAKGIIVEYGGLLSHAAIITRELGIPSIIGVEGALQILKTGMTVSLNPANGTVDIIDQ
jgi:pyruvate,water dikinase